MVPQASAASREIQETYVASCGAEMSFGSAGTGGIYTALCFGETNGRDGYLVQPMTHQQVIENFVTEGQRGIGSYVKATKDVLYSRIPARWRGNRFRPAERAPLAVRLKDESLLVNGAGFSWPINGHQRTTLRIAEASKSRFGVVPFHSIVAAWTDGEVDDWDRAPVPTKDLQKEVSIVVPSQGERWKQVKVKDKHG